MKHLKTGFYRGFWDLWCPFFWENVLFDQYWMLPYFSRLNPGIYILYYIILYIYNSVWTEFSGCGFKSHSGQLSITTSENPSVMNTICINHFIAKVITCVRFCLKQMWWLTKAIAEMKCKHWTKKWNWSSCTKLTLRSIWTHGLMAHLVKVSEQNLVVVGSNPTQANFL